MHIFYDIRNLSLRRKKALLIDALALSDEWWIDVLDCSKSLARQRIDMEFGEMLKKLKSDCHFVVIDREFYPTDKFKHFEIGFSTMSGTPAYYLWIRVADRHMPNLLKKYKLAKWTK